jgi:hypothetical protein
MYMLEYACHNGHKQVVKALLSILNAEELVGIAEQRLEFFVVRDSISELMFPVDPAVLQTFCALERAWKSQTIALGISEEAWLGCRSTLTTLTIFSAMFIALEISCDQTPSSVQQIVVPSNFQYSSYVEDIAEVIRECEFNFNYSIADWKTLSYELQKMCTEDVATRVGRKTTLSAANLFVLFSSTPIDQTREEVIQFLQDVECKVLGIPEVRISYKDATRSIGDVMKNLSHQHDWTEQEAANGGPYSSKEKSRQSLTNSNQKGNPVHHPDISSLAINHQDGTPVRKQSDAVSNAVNNLQRKYALQDPLEEVVATESAKKRKREAKDTHLSSTGNKRGKLASAPDTSTKKKSIIESRPSGSKINFDKVDEDIGGYDTDEDQLRTAQPSRAMEILNHARHRIDDTHKKFGLPTGGLQDEQSNFHTDNATRLPKKSTVTLESFNRNPKLGTRNRITWTAEEKEALKEGLRRYGIGGWKDILLDVHLGSLLRSRTNVDLKDKYRTMIKSREITEEEFHRAENIRIAGGTTSNSNSASKRRNSRSSVGTSDSEEDEN